MDEWIADEWITIMTDHNFMESFGRVSWNNDASKSLCSMCFTFPAIWQMDQEYVNLVSIKYMKDDSWRISVTSCQETFHEQRFLTTFWQHSGNMKPSPRNTQHILQDLYGLLRPRKSWWYFYLDRPYIIIFETPASYAHRTVIHHTLGSYMSPQWATIYLGILIYFTADIQSVM